jgi:cellulose synthase/poly-beta-1,6-N-acetylglucosamine synthase-like glycosyltransferase
MNIDYSDKFTVLMSVWKNDCPDLFDKSVGSVFSNSINPTCFILVVDGAVTNAINNVINKYQRFFNFKVLRLKKNHGLALALNKALDLVNTEWVIRADADDINHKDRFKILLKYMTINIDLVGSFVNEIDWARKIYSIKQVPLKAEAIAKFLVRRNPFNHMSVAFRTDMVKKCGGYPNIYLREDYALWALLIKEGARVRNIPDILVEANAGYEMYLKRGGIRYAFGEFALQKHLTNCGVKSFPPAFFDGLIRFCFFILPVSLRAIGYKIFLRRKKYI